MKEKKLVIVIDKPVAEVLLFVINPANTPLWVDSIVEEETSEWPVKLGTIYKNKNRIGIWTTYAVDKFDGGGMFRLTSGDGNYHVKYTLTSVGNNSCQLEYFEWVDKGGLAEPFTVEILQKLKTVLEN